MRLEELDGAMSYGDMNLTVDLSDSLSAASSSPKDGGDGGGGGGGEVIRAKRGRPRLTEDAELAKQKRRAQLREAQKGLRERKTRYLEGLQNRIAELEQENSQLKSTSAIAPPFEG